MMAWTVLWADALASGFIKYETFDTNAASVTMFDLHWNAVQVHVGTGGLIDWHASGQLSIGLACLGLGALIISAIPLTLMTLANVAILHT